MATKLLSWVSCFLAGFSFSQATQNYPNFVMILADDMGWGDTSYNGGTAQTPFLDSWTKQSNTITFLRGYAASPVCSPTRASIMSGRTPNRDCIYAASLCGSKPAAQCSEKYAFPTNTFNIVDAVKKANPEYNTAFLGKWHLGDFWVKKEANDMFNPTQMGFDYWLATEASAPTVDTNCGCFESHSECIVGHYTDGPWCTEYWYEDETQTNQLGSINEKVLGSDTMYLVDQFENWLGDIDLEQPFLALIFLHAVHEPFLALDEWRDACESYDTCSELPDGEKYSSAQLDYFGALSSMDSQIERVHEILSDNNVIDNTLIWFTSDNGPAGNVGSYGDTESPGSTNGLKGRKRDVWEGGIRVPSIIQYNSLIGTENGFASEYPIVTYDFLPTIMDLLQIESDNPSWAIDGESLLPVLNSPETLLHRDKEMGWIRDSTGAVAFTKDIWKLVVHSQICENKECKPALYKLDDDPSETTDLRYEEPEIYSELHQKMKLWQKSVIKSQYDESGCASRSSLTPMYDVFIGVGCFLFVYMSFYGIRKLWRMWQMNSNSDDKNTDSKQEEIQTMLSGKTIDISKL